MNLGYPSESWVKNSQGERLLGVSISGQPDSEVCPKLEILRALQEEAVRVNKEYAKRFGIPQSTYITAVKPSENLSQTVSYSSGLPFLNIKFTISSKINDPRFFSINKGY